MDINLLYFYQKKFVIQQKSQAIINAVDDYMLYKYWLEQITSTFTNLVIERTNLENLKYQHHNK